MKVTYLPMADTAVAREESHTSIDGCLELILWVRRMAYELGT